MKILSLLLLLGSITTCADKISEKYGVESFENGLPEYAKASRPEGISVSRHHYKSGKKSLQWNYKKNDTIRFNHGIGNIYRTGGYGGTYGKATFAVWVYCEKPQHGALKFEFRTGNKVSGSFDFPLNFTGWQRAALRYSWKPMFDGKVSPATDNILIIAPEISGRCFIDLMCYNIIKDFRTQFRPSGTEWQPPVIDKKQYPMPCEITDSDKEAIIKIRDVFAPEGKNQITEKSIQSLKGSIEKLDIIKEKDRISGIPVIFPADGYEAEGITDFVSPGKSQTSCCGSPQPITT